MTRIGIPKEIQTDERRVAASPQSVIKLIKLGFEVAVESNAGLGSDYTNSAYLEAGATIVDDAKELWKSSDVILKVRPPEENPVIGVHEVDLMRDGGTLVSFIWAGQNKELLNRLAKKKATVFSMDSVPRITRAQKMDALSAMANIAGYRAVIEAANHLSRFFGGQITAAGRVDPAKVLVIGAGVAGLSAIGTARSVSAQSFARSIRVRRRRIRSKVWARIFSKFTSRKKAKAKAVMRNRCPTNFSKWKWSFSPSKRWKLTSSSRPL